MATAEGDAPNQSQAREPARPALCTASIRSRHCPAHGVDNNCPRARPRQRRGRQLDLGTGGWDARLRHEALIGRRRRGCRARALPLQQGGDDADGSMPDGDTRGDHDRRRGRLVSRGHRKRGRRAVHLPGPALLRRRRRGGDRGHIDRDLGHREQEDQPHREHHREPSIRQSSRSSETTPSTWTRTRASTRTSPPTGT